MTLILFSTISFVLFMGYLTFIGIGEDAIEDERNERLDDIEETKYQEDQQLID